MTFRERNEGVERKFVAEISFGRTGAEVPLLADAAAPVVVVEGDGLRWVLPVGVMGWPLLKKTLEAAETGLSPFLLSLGVRVGTNSVEVAVVVGRNERGYCWDVVGATVVYNELFVRDVRSFNGYAYSDEVDGWKYWFSVDAGGYKCADCDGYDCACCVCGCCC